MSAFAATADISGRDRRGMAVSPHRWSGSCGGRDFAGGTRDRNYRGHLLRENPWLQLQGSVDQARRVLGATSLLFHSRERNFALRLWPLSVQV